MTYSETLEYFFAQLPMYHRIGPAAFKKDLTNTLALCAHLGNPHHKLRAIHIAGTNGKGSVSHMLSAILQAAGYKTGLYISPHYKDFRERIKIDGQMIPKRRVTAFLEKNKPAIEAIQPSFFEMTVALAFDYFTTEQVDIAVIETGLGGRLDSTNVITPMLSVITNIGFDHMAMLGDTLPAIAGEKAGIIKPGVPVVVGESHPETLSVFEAAAHNNKATLSVADRHWTLEPSAAPGVGKSVFNVFYNTKSWGTPLNVDAGGPYQQKNVATVLEAILQMQKQMPIPENAIREGLSNLRKYTGFMGRWQVIGRNPLILCDSAHNEPGITLAFSEIAKWNFKNIHIITGFVNDKDIDNILGLLPKTARYYFAKANIPRGLDAALLREKASGFGLKGKSYRSVRQALAAARMAAHPNDLILVIGSIFVVAEAV